MTSSLLHPTPKFAKWDGAYAFPLLEVPTLVSWCCEDSLHPGHVGPSEGKHTSSLPPSLSQPEEDPPSKRHLTFTGCASMGWGENTTSWLHSPFVFSLHQGGFCTMSFC